MTKPILAIPFLCKEAQAFATVESVYPEPTLYGVTDGKAVGTYCRPRFPVGVRPICAYN